jgi:catechol 2,3-dioxygenase-like lactoylglutathione lyase family enzyme
MAPSIPPPTPRLLETAIYVQSVARSRHFYEHILGLAPLSTPDPADPDPRLFAMRLPGPQVFLIFKRGASTHHIDTGGGLIPPTDAQGQTHFAFAIDANALDAWRAHLEAHNVTIESEVRWERGGLSLYFRDPDGHLVELATPGVWETY